MYYYAFSFSLRFIFNISLGPLTGFRSYTEVNYHNGIYGTRGTLIIQDMKSVSAKRTLGGRDSRLRHRSGQIMLYILHVVMVSNGNIL